MAELIENIITLEELKTYIAIPLAKKELDDFLIDCINEASSTIKTYCNNDIVPTVHELLTIDGNGNSKIFLPYYPISGITVLKRAINPWDEGRDPDTGFEDLLTSPATIEDNVEIHSCWIQLLGGFSFPEGDLNIQISYSGGFNPIPATIKSVCKKMAAMSFYESKAGERRLGLSSENVGSGASSSRTFKTEDFYSSLDPFRRINV